MIKNEFGKHNCNDSLSLEIKASCNNLQNIKVCSINFEPPDIDLSAPRATFTRFFVEHGLFQYDFF